MIQSDAEAARIVEHICSLPLDEAVRAADALAAQAGELIAARYRDAVEIVVANGGAPPRLCHGCALKCGTDANTSIRGIGGLATALSDGEPFYCHEDLAPDGEPTKFCAGWVTLMAGVLTEGSQPAEVNP